MPLRDDLLVPIPGENPSGSSLRYDKTFDQIKEARIEDDSSIPSGDWGRAAKKADTLLVIKLAGEALATRTKDLQLAAWLIEAHLKCEGFSLLNPCLRLVRDLQELFWDTLYPQPDEGDMSVRAVPVEWLANRCATILRQLGLTKSGLHYFKYKESRAVGYEVDAESNESKREQRAAAIDDGKLTAEAFDAAFNRTPKVFYLELEATIEEAQQQLVKLEEFHEQRYGNDSPNMEKLRTSIAEVKQVVGSLLTRKRETEPDAIVETIEESEVVEEQFDEVNLPQAAKVATPVRNQVNGASRPAEPQSVDDAFSMITAAALYLGAETPESPIPYLLAIAIRWGELRAVGSPSYEFMTAPSTEIRQTLKRLSSDSSWQELLSKSVLVLGEPCGRVWLDVHRYIWKAADSCGYASITQTVIASVRAILRDFPSMVEWSLDDDTPAANADTRAWIQSDVLPHEREPRKEVEIACLEDPPGGASPSGATPDVYEEATELLRSGKARQAIDLLMRDSAQQLSGRLRFLRRVQVAQLCLSAGQDMVAYPLLKNLADEISSRSLETWEASAMLAQPLSLLLKVVDDNHYSDIDRDKIFTILCRIDPTAAFGPLP